MNKVVGLAMLTFLACGQVQTVMSESVQAQTAQDRKVEADRLLKQGAQLYRISRYREAIQVLESALLIYQDIRPLAELKINPEQRKF